MAFYDLNGNQLNLQQFIQKYESFYFLNTPNVGRRITRRNKTNPYVENRIENILQNGLTTNDLVFVIAWKIGAIDHQASNNQIVYRNNFNNTLIFNTRFYTINVNKLVNYITNNFDMLVQAADNPHDLLNLLLNNRGRNSFFGLIYCLTLIYFFTRGDCPIYDKYAHISCIAYQENIQPGNKINYRQINDWVGYNKYIMNIKKIFSTQKIPRSIDRSLWVYGHYF